MARKFAAPISRAQRKTKKTGGREKEGREKSPGPEEKRGEPRSPPEREREREREEERERKRERRLFFTPASRAFPAGSRLLARSPNFKAVPEKKRQCTFSGARAPLLGRLDQSKHHWKLYTYPVPATSRGGRRNPQGQLTTSEGRRRGNPKGGRGEEEWRD